MENPIFPDLSPRLLELMPKLKGRLLPNQPLAPLTWFRAGGAAQIVFTPADEEDLAYFLSRLPDEIAVTTVGVGSNLIVRDGGVEGVVIRLSPKGFGQLDHVGKGQLNVGAAVLDKKLAETALHHQVGGFEFFFGIPGSLGGALRMNAGANGGETKDVLVYATGVNRDGDLVTFSNEEMLFGYRACGVPADVIFTSALLAGRCDGEAAIRARMDDVQRHREEAQPIREKTGGSTFRNPPGHSAWKLIDEAGCRGLRLGGAQVSELHCNFLINTGDATAADIENLGEEVRRRVWQSSGIELQWEIKRIGRQAA
ncbi:MAG: UDP-N-acetylmuramate dehydrogenase [Methylocystis sp.]|nr:UDP-N-acetylmuramate dehydrogenase [Methylocystis sp.]MCA3583367.1 UDP-N-acetylmuramate dehydrogenase [Methylocystis sp.]MCA3589747.1 UDP-N-acetylmuramate dehydrogenase [Methylocystis sp.]MCA3591886.1 UDP-N-acetylmuramate dehydrogenase [Methylocystis sp.]